MPVSAFLISMCELEDQKIIETTWIWKYILNTNCEESITILSPGTTRPERNWWNRNSTWSGSNPLHQFSMFPLLKINLLQGSKEKTPKPVKTVRYFSTSSNLWVKRTTVPNTTPRMFPNNVMLLSWLSCGLHPRVCKAFNWHNWRHSQTVTRCLIWSCVHAHFKFQLAGMIALE